MKLDSHEALKVYLQRNMKLMAMDYGVNYSNSSSCTHSLKSFMLGFEDGVLPSHIRSTAFRHAVSLASKRSTGIRSQEYDSYEALRTAITFTGTNRTPTEKGMDHLLS
jgi:hypothetical protein